MTSRPHSEPDVLIIRNAIDGAMIGTGGQLLAHQQLDNLLEQLEAWKFQTRRYAGAEVVRLIEAALSNPAERPNA